MPFAANNRDRRMFGLRIRTGKRDDQRHVCVFVLSDAYHPFVDFKEIIRDCDCNLFD